VPDSLFDRAIAFLLPHEGGYSDHPADPGGPTNWGISLRFLRAQGADLGDIDGDGDIDAADVRHLPIDIAMQLYRREWWDRYRYARLPELAAIKIFDLAVTTGPHAAHRCLQRALWACGRSDIAEDGVIGPVTLQAAQTVPSQLAIQAAMRSEAAGWFRLLVLERPALAPFRAGWLRRAYA